MKSPTNDAFRAGRPGNNSLSHQRLPVLRPAEVSDRVSRPGSGNTKNIGSVTKIEQLISGTGPFAALGEEVYDDYWMFYLTRDMAEALSVQRPYMNLKTYRIQEPGDRRAAEAREGDCQTRSRRRPATRKKTHERCRSCAPQMPGD